MFKTDFSQKTPTGTVSAFCSHPFQHFKVTCEGYVTMCCWQKRKCLGNILEQGFEKIWFGELAEEIRRETMANQMHSACSVKACPFFFREKQGSPVIYRGYPSRFEIDLPTQHCNIGGEQPSASNPACIMCERHTNFIWQEDRLLDVCKALRPFIRHVASVHIQGIAEPFWKDLIFDVINWLGIDQYKNRIRITTTTNGTLMTEERRKRFLQYPKSSITWSIDAATPETYVKIRRVNMYDKIAEYLMAYSNERTRDQHLQIHNNINLLNVNEVVGMVELAAKAKVDLLDFNPTCSVPVITVDQSNYKLFRKAQLEIIEAAKNLRVKTTFMRNLTLDLDESIPAAVHPYQDVRTVPLTLKKES